MAKKTPLLTITQRRIEGTFYIFLLPLFFLVGRLVQLQALPAAQESLEASAPEPRTTELPARRGQILAEDGTALAVTLDEYTVAVNPRAIEDRKKMADLLVSSIGGSREEYLTALQKTTQADGKPNYYVRLARGVDEDRIEKLKALQKPPKDRESREEKTARKAFWAPVSIEGTPRRYYPLGEFASQLLGFTTPRGQGADGLEKAWDEQLSGTPGKLVSQVDSRGRPIPGLVEKWSEPVAGHTLVTTIDAQIQADTDAVMQKLVEKFKPNFAVAVVMRPQTGEIVAVTTAPLFDLNHKPSNVVELATNRAFQFAYEPGSTFKVITAAAAVEEVPDWRNHSFHCNGIQPVGNRNMRCWVNSTSKRRHGQEDLSESIRDSCNFGVYGFARLFGAPKLLDYTKRFGLGEKIDLKGVPTHPGVLPRNAPSDWGQVQLANFAFGQGMMMTPLQMASMAATVANDGLMMKPMLIKEVRDEEGHVIQQWQPKEQRRVIEPETARTVAKMMERVVKEGTASKFVWVPGYMSAGKTGSAQKAIGRSGYAAGKFISSFVGFLPSDKPEFVIAIMADEPRGSHWGSEVCGPAYKEIAEKAMLHLRLREGSSAPAPVAELMEPAKIKS